jgi:hypothetical protein
MRCHSAIKCITYQSSLTDFKHLIVLVHIVFALCRRYLIHIVLSLLCICFELVISAYHTFVYLMLSAVVSGDCVVYYIVLFHYLRLLHYCIQW